MNKDHKDGFLHQTQPALKTKYIVHFSDNHLYYKEKSKDESQRNDGSKDNYVLDSNNRAAPDHEIIQPAYGEDAPLELIEIAMQYAKDMIEKPAFFLYTGDSNSHPHGKYADRHEVRQRVIKNIRTMRSYYKDSVWITSVIGNTDSTPGFYMPIPEMGKEITTIAVIADAWKDTLTHEEMEQLKLYGYVAYPVDEKLVVITLNTIVYATNYRRGEELLADPLGQFKRLEKELDKLREEGKVAYICGHVPPSVGSYKGKLQWLSDYIQKYISIVESYGDVIKAQLFGHLHSNEVRLSFEKSLPPLFITTAISPKYLNNPAFIIWEYNPTTYELTDFVLHGTDITKEYPYVAFKPLFRATDAYGLEDLSLGSLRELVTKMETNNGDNDLVRNYHWNSKAQSPKFYGKCSDNNCWARVLCSLNWFKTGEEFTECLLDRKAETDKQIAERKKYERSKSSATQSMRLLLPATETRSNQNSDYSIVWALVTVFLAVILLGMTSFGLRRIIGIKPSYTRWVKGRKMGKM